MKGRKDGLTRGEKYVKMCLGELQGGFTEIIDPRGDFYEENFKELFNIDAFASDPYVVFGM